MGAVADRDTRVTLKLAKSYAKVSGSAQDDLFDILIPASAEVADEYLNNPFEDEDGVEVDIPYAISLGRLVWIKTEVEARPPGVVKEKAGDWMTEYSQGGEVQISEDVERHWKCWRFPPRDDDDADATLQSPLYVGA